MSDDNTRLTLIQRAQDQNNELAWAEFTEIYKNYIYVIVSKMGVYTNDCEDVVQQVMVKLWQKLPDFKYDHDRARFRTWLSSITHHTVVDFIRKQVSSSNKHNKAKDDVSLDFLSSITLPQVEEIAEREWELYIMRLALSNITEFFNGKAIEVFLKSVDGVSGEQIAQELELGLDTVYVLKARVKKRLAQEIKRLQSEIE